jgi:hypothetical protein
MGDANPMRSVANHRFWWCSFALHVVLLGGLLLLVPVREYRQDKHAPPPVITRGEELDAVIEQIRWRKVEQLAARVALLKQGQQRMALHQENFNSHYTPFAETQQAAAVGRFEENLKALVHGVAELEELLKAADEQGVFASYVEKGVPMLPRLSAALDEVRRAMVLMDWEVATLWDEQAEAEDALWRLGPVLRRVVDDQRAIDDMHAELTLWQERFPLIQADWERAVQARDQQLVIRQEAIEQRDEARRAARASSLEAERKAHLEQADRHEQVREGTVEAYRVFYREADQLTNQRNGSERRIAGLEERLTARREQRVKHMREARDAFLRVAPQIEAHQQRLAGALHAWQVAQGGGDE